MATPYSVIYNRFSVKCTDFHFSDYDDATLQELLLTWLQSAIARTRRLEHDLSNRNDEELEFSDDLSNNEIEILACGMLTSWIDQYLHSTENLLQIVGGKEEKFYSQSAHIAELRALKSDNEREIRRLHNYYTYQNSSYWDD